jgi:hypothetical protein
MASTVFSINALGRPLAVFFPKGHFSTCSDIAMLKTAGKASILGESVLASLMLISNMRVFAPFKSSLYPLVLEVPPQAPLFFLGRAFLAQRSEAQQDFGVHSIQTR